MTGQQVQFHLQLVQMIQSINNNLWWLKMTQVYHNVYSSKFMNDPWLCCQIEYWYIADMTLTSKITLYITILIHNTYVKHKSKTYTDVLKINIIIGICHIEKWSSSFLVRDSPTLTDLNTWRRVSQVNGLSLWGFCSHS